MSDSALPIDNSGLPKDDSGISHDRAIDLCEFVIDALWDRYIGSPMQKSAPTSAELREVAESISVVWALAMDIIEFDHQLQIGFDPGIIEDDIIDEEEDNDGDGSEDDEE